MSEGFTNLKIFLILQLVWRLLNVVILVYISFLCLSNMCESATNKMCVRVSFLTSRHNFCLCLSYLLQATFCLARHKIAGTKKKIQFFYKRAWFLAAGTIPSIIMLSTQEKFVCGKTYIKWKNITFIVIHDHFHLG